jgi:transcriptional regulator with XRE-family HTH domain
MRGSSKRGPSTAAKGPMKTFAKRLQRLRQARAMSQKDLAQLLGAQVALVSRYERGLIIPSASTIIDLARILQVSTDELLTGSTKDSLPPQIRHATLFDRFRRFDEEIDDRKDLEAVIAFLDAFLAKKQIRKIASA